ncbi:MAG: HAMP domain-containing protein [Deltaproteobacteria bacterium]|nr:HAMP domain-containing protein [Deltaproteobacteria bacterium]
MIKPNRYIDINPSPPLADRIKRRREIILIVFLLACVGILTFVTLRPMWHSADISASNMIWLFILMNVNLILVLLMIFLVFRNFIKAFYERRSRIPGTRLRTKLVVAFGALTLLPAGVLFFFSIHFIGTSIEFWFKVPIEQALQNSLSVGRSFYSHVESNNTFFLDKAAYQIASHNLLSPDSSAKLFNYAQVVQREFNLNAVEAYNSNFKRLCLSTAEKFPAHALLPLKADDLQKGLAQDENTWSMSENIPEGELIRNIAAIPFAAHGLDVKGFIVISVLLPSEMAKNLTSISRGLEEYQQIKMLKQPIQATYYIILTVVALLVVFCATWLGIYIARSITVPIMKLAEGTRRVAEGDLSYSINVVADDEIKTLVDSFNTMTKELRFNRRQIEASGNELKKKSAEIDERRRYMEIVLNNVSTGVISIDSRGLITTINASAEKMLKLHAGDVIKKSYKSLLFDQHQALTDEIMERFTLRHEESFSKSMALTINGQRRVFKNNFSALKDESGRQIGIVMVFDDMTELEKAQRMAAWREVARRIAHEVKNPLTPISLSAQRLKRKYGKAIDDPIFDECTKTIIDYTGIIRNLVNEFSSFAKFPTANPMPCSLGPIIGESVALYREGHTDIRFFVEIEEDLPMLKLDRQQIRQVMINLMDNAIASIGGSGEIRISARVDAGIVRIIVADTGAGIKDADKPFLFEPDFTTKPTGMGLGLAIVSTIISEHKGKIYAEDNKPQGAKFVIELPAS